MNALLTNGLDTTASKPDSATNGGRQQSGFARTAALFAAFYVALVAASPLVVRYGPTTDDRAMTALVARMQEPRCAQAPDAAHCAVRTLVARDLHAADEPDL